MEGSSFFHLVIPFFSSNEAPIPTHFFMILTSCGNSTLSPVNCVGPLQTKSFILPHRPDHTESCAVSTTAGSSPTRFYTSAHLCGNMLITTLVFLCLLFFLEWVRPVVGGGLAAVSRGTGQRHWAPGWTKLLPRQVISGRDATAQDISTECLKSE